MRIPAFIALSLVYFYIFGPTPSTSADFNFEAVYSGAPSSSIGDVSGLPDPFAGLPAGSKITGQFSYDPSASGTVVFTGFANYPGQGISAQLFGGPVSQTNPGIAIGQGSSPSNNFFSIGTNALSLPSSPGHSFDYSFNVFLSGSSAGSLSLPTSLSLGSYNTNLFKVNEDNFTNIGPPIGSRNYSLAITQLAPTSSFASYIDGAVDVHTVSTSGGSNTGIVANFTPNFGMTLKQLATLGGYTNFNWVQSLTNIPSPSPYYSKSCSIPGICTPFTATPDHPILDPPSGGYFYEPAGYDPAPFYVPNGPLLNTLNGQAPSPQIPSLNNTLAETASTLIFFDNPQDPCLAGGPANIYCLFQHNSDPTQKLEFVTNLVGVKADGTWDPLFQFAWDSNFNGTSGGIGRLAGDVPIDAGSGTGGISILSETQLTPSTPLPAALPLFASGLGALGLLGWRRKRKAQSAG